MKTEEDNYPQNRDQNGKHRNIFCNSTFMPNLKKIGMYLIYLDRFIC